MAPSTADGQCKLVSGVFAYLFLQLSNFSFISPILNFFLFSLTYFFLIFISSIKGVMCSPPFVCLSVFFINSLSQKVMKGCQLNFCEGLGAVQVTIN